MKKRLLSLFLAVAIFLSLHIPALAADPESVFSVEDAGEGDIVILYTNDIHTYIDGALRYSTVAALRSAYEAAGAQVLLVDAGDHVQGTAYGSMDSGATIIELMNAAGYDLATPGNHEFDYGMDGCLNAVAQARFSYVSCNFYHEENGIVGDTVLDGYHVFDLGGTKIAFIGITTPESISKSTPAYFQNEDGAYIYGIAGGADGSDLYAAVQAAIDEASAEADYVIALGHLGVDPSSRPWTSEETIANTVGLDAFIDGHSHTVIEGKTVTDKEGDPVLLTQTGEYLGAIGKMILSADGNITTELLTAADLAGLAGDPDVAAAEEAWISEINEQLGVVIGTLDVTLDNFSEDGTRLVRKQETNTGDFCADALYYLFDSMDLDVDVAIMNGGGIRNQAISGEISYLTCKTIHPYGNVACLQTVTGQQILDALEWGARSTDLVEVGGFMQVSGLRYSIDATIDSTVQQSINGIWIGSPTGEYRVRDVEVYNKQTAAWDALDPQATYNLAGYNYTLRDLGDGFAMFDDAVNIVDYVMPDYLVLSSYVQAFENSVVGAKNSPLNEKYPDFGCDYSTVVGSGRITVITAEQEQNDTVTIGGLDNNIWVTKHGNLYCDMPAARLMELGFDWGDLVSVEILGRQIVLPLVPSYAYVESGEAALIAQMTDGGTPTGYVSFAINMGSFATTYGIATKNTDEAGAWWWTACEGVDFPLEVTFTLYEKGGYAAEYLLYGLVRSNDRADYEQLSDEEFANFRPITVGNIGTSVLYRSSSPIDPKLGRNGYADAALSRVGVLTILNLADTADTAAAYEGFADTYYAGQSVLYLLLSADFTAEDYRVGLAEGLRYMATHEGPYLIHCSEGKDRAGFVCALLECLMGASYDEVVDDYMQSFRNYYGIEKGTEQYDLIAESNIVKSLCLAFDVADLSVADLQAEARAYLLDLGLTDEELDALCAKLSGQEQTVQPEPEPSGEPTAPVSPAAPDDASGDSLIAVAVIVCLSVCLLAVVVPLLLRKRKRA